MRNRQIEVCNKRSLWFNPKNTWKQNHRGDKLTVNLTKCFLFVIMLSPILKGLHTLSTENKNQIANSQKSIIHKKRLTVKVKFPLAISCSILHVVTIYMYYRLKKKTKKHGTSLLYWEKYSSKPDCSV